LKTIQAGANAERRRLYDSFEVPISAAIGAGDDLVKIDELRRLQSLPGVLSAQVLINSPWPAESRVLKFQNKNVGALRVRLSSAPWKRLRTRLFERLLIEIGVLGLLGMLVGLGAARFQRAHVHRLYMLLKRRRARHWRLLKSREETVRGEILPWTRQALEFCDQGLILLDSRQVVIAANRAARRSWTLRGDIEGRHWLELFPEADWFAALDRSLVSPGSWLPGPTGADQAATRLLTFSGELTWIVSGIPASQARKLIV